MTEEGQSTLITAIKGQFVGCETTDLYCHLVVRRGKGWMGAYMDGWMDGWISYIGHMNRKGEITFFKTTSSNFANICTVSIMRK